ncbi:hypothetical protein BSFP_066990 [Burkholderia stabilis]|uniref:Uncharacterized protein n=1 Tax=Burkholderia stabilis TaxID=95485 RepID=A0A1Y1BXE3_9BURK|nr:hypothetical protein BSFP_066990 [Burkholderia stabilis]
MPKGTCGLRSRDRDGDPECRAMLFEHLFSYPK